MEPEITKRNFRQLRPESPKNEKRNARACDALKCPYNGGAMKFTRITVEADRMGGVPCIRGLRVPVATVVAMVADGMTEPEILKAYPYLEAQDIREALRYAAEAVRERAIPIPAP